MRMKGIDRKWHRNRRGFTIGELLTVFVIVILMSFLLAPVVKRVSARTNEVLCANNVRELGRALYIYARENDKRFPETLKVLYDEEYISDKSLVDCPASEAKGTPEDPDYIYTAGLTVRSPSAEPLVRDKEKNHPSGGRNVMYVNGPVRWQK